MPVITITTPNARGVSRNIYQNFNVGRPGAVFNNSTAAGQSQLAGQLGANANLTASGPAKLILNEVTGGSLSSLLGYVEIFGAKADFILANPAGISCNGCGFINTPRVTLTTGTPSFDSSGAFTGFTVSTGNGQISFGSGGADITGVSTFDVVSRSIFVGGVIGDTGQAAEVGLFSGFNSFDYASRSVTALAGDGSSAPAYGVNMNAQGGIRAGRIGITGTEKGVGASAGNLQAGAGGMYLTADGKLVIAKAQSQGAVRLKSQSADIEIQGAVWSQVSLTLWAGGNISVLAQASAGSLGNVSVNAQGITLNSGAELGAGLDGQGNFTGSGSLNLYAADLTNGGTLRATQDISIALTGALNNQAASSTTTITWLGLSSQPAGAASVQPAGQIEAGRNLSASAAQVTNAGSVTAGQNAAFNVSGALANQASGSIQAGGKLNITAGSLVNYGSTDLSQARGVISGQLLYITASDIENAGKLQAAGDLTVNSSGQVVNVLGTMQAGGYVSVTAAGNVENLSGLVEGQGVAVNAATIENVTLVSRDGALEVPAAFATALVTAGSQAGKGGPAGLFSGYAASTAPSSLGVLVIQDQSGSARHTDTAAQQASITATNGVVLNASKDINNVGGKLAAGGGVTVQAQELSTVKNASNFTTTHVKSALSAGGNVTINAKGDATIQASNVTSGKNTAITAGGGVTLSAAQDEKKTYSSSSKCTDWVCSGKKTTVHSSDDITAVSTAINSGGWVEVEAKSGDVAATATNVTAQASIKLLADLGNVLLEAGQNSSASRSYVKKTELWGLSGSAHSSASSSVTVAPTFVSAVNDVQLTSHADLVVKASSVKAGGNIAVTAQNVDLEALQNLTATTQMNEKWGFFASASAGNGTAGVTLAWQDSKTTTSDVQYSSQGASLEAGGNLSINAGGNLNVTGSTVTAAGDVNVRAAQVNLAAAQDTETKQTTTTTDSFGILPAMNNGFGFAIGANLVTDKTGAATVSSIGALIGSTGGSVFIDASGRVNAQGSIIESLSGNVTVTAPTIAMAAGIDSFSSYAYHSATFIGIDVAVEAGANNPLSAVQKGAGFLSAADKTHDGQAKLLYEAAAGVQAGQGLLNVYKGMNAPGGLTQGLTSFDVKIGVGVSVAKSEWGETAQQASGGMILAAGNLGLYATAGDLTLKGATVSAYNVTLSAQRDVVMQSLALTDTSYARSSSVSAFVGLGASVGMDPQSGSMKAEWGIKASASDATSQSLSVAVNHAQTTVNGAGFVTLASGRDTSLYGAEVSGGGIAAQVARNLTIASDQDTGRMTAAQSSWSLSGTIGLYGSPSSISGSYAKGDAYGHYASVTTTAGLFAGTGGYAVTVGGTTTLTAAALASRADASKNSLATGALVTQNLANSMSWKASSWGFSFSVSNAGMGGVQPGLGQKQSGHSSGLAQAAIAPGNISIVNASLQKALTGKTPEQIVAALNRSATALNKAADRLPGALAQTLQNQADRSAALTAASSSTAKLVGDVATMLYAQAAQTVAKYAKNPPQSQAQQDELDAAKLQESLWNDGGAARLLLHGATQGVLAWLGGGFSLDAGLRGAGGAIAASYLAPLIVKEAQAFLNDAGLDNSAKPGPLAGLIGEVVMTGLSSAFGNMAGVTAASVTINNYLTHAQIMQEIEELQGCQGDRGCIDGVVAKYDLLNGIQDDAFRLCTTQTCLAGAWAAINEELPTLGKDVQALIDAGCATCLAQIGFNSPQHSSDSAYVASYCMSNPGPNCASWPDAEIVGKNALGLGLIVAGGAAIELAPLWAVGGAATGDGVYLAHQWLANQPITAEGLVFSTGTGAVFGVAGYAAPEGMQFVAGFLTGVSAVSLADQALNYSNLTPDQRRVFWVDAGFTAAALFTGVYSAKSPSTIAEQDGQPLLLTPPAQPQGNVIDLVRNPTGVYELPQESLALPAPPAANPPNPGSLTAALSEDAGSTLPAEAAAARVAAGTGGELRAPAVQASAPEAAAGMTGTLGGQPGLGAPLTEAANAPAGLGEGLPAAAPPVNVARLAAGTEGELPALASSAQANAAEAAARAEAGVTQALGSEPRVIVPAEAAATAIAKADSTAANALAAEVKLGVPANANAGGGKPEATAAKALDSIAGANEQKVFTLTSPDQVEATTPVESTGWHGQKSMYWELRDSKTGAVFSRVHADIQNPNRPGPPDQALKPKEAPLPDGAKVQLKADFSFTDISLKKNKEVWEKLFNRPLENYGGNILWENLANFQHEYNRLREEHKTWTPQQLGDEAIRHVSFGKGRIRIGYGDLKVTIDNFEDIEIPVGPYKGERVRDVPTKVDISAKKTSGQD